MKGSILLVEDELDAREFMTASLRTHGFEVEEAVDGGQAVRKAAQRVHDVVVMDVSLPVLDGIEAIRRIRQQNPTKRAHVIVLSGQLDARTRQRAFEAGCDQYVVKPVSAEGLIATIDTFFAKRDGAS